MIWLAAGAASASPGALTSASELAAIRAAADAGSSPQKENRDRLLQDARKSWAWGSTSGAWGTVDVSGSKKCQPSNGGSANYLLEGAPDSYAQALGAHLSGDASLASQARTHVLDLVDTTGFSGLSGADYSANNQCVLDLSLSIPVWVETARLLEDTSVWSATDTDAFRSWLALQVYPKVAWASRVRRNNWGAAGSLAAYTIANYVTSTTTLREVAPAALSLTASQAASAHTTMQLSRVANSWMGDAQCTKLGIQWHGGIPEELRRGSTGCDGTYLVATDSSYTYQSMHTELLVFHAEAMRRNGDLRLYQAAAPQGGPAILKAILFVVANPSSGGKSWSWDPTRWGTLITAASVYVDATLASVTKNDGTSSFRGGRTLPYTRVTARPLATATGAQLGAPGKPSIVP
jgi:hypothetical protein